jgi:hypothetical protein
MRAAILTHGRLGFDASLGLDRLSGPLGNRRRCHHSALVPQRFNLPIESITRWSSLVADPYLLILACQLLDQRCPSQWNAVAGGVNSITRIDRQLPRPQPADVLRRRAAAAGLNTPASHVESSGCCRSTRQGKGAGSVTASRRSPSFAFMVCGKTVSPSGPGSLRPRAADSGKPRSLLSSTALDVLLGMSIDWIFCASPCGPRERYIQRRATREGNGCLRSRSTTSR